MTPCPRCTHPTTAHGRDRKGRPTCFGSSMCGCTEQPSRRIPELPQTADVFDYLRQKGEIA